MHRIFLAHPLPASIPAPLAIQGEEAHHAARVKRLEAGEMVQLLDGRGGVASARLQAVSKSRGEWRLDLVVEKVTPVPPVRPRVEVYSPAPKGSGLTDMIEGLSQAGAASWGLLETSRSVTEPRLGKLQRLERTAVESAKQCGRAWLLEIAPVLNLQQGLQGGSGERIVVADAAGAPYVRSGAETVRVLLGPEGGWTPEELDLARAGSAEICTFGPHIMRIEIAALAAATVVIDHESRR